MSSATQVRQKNRLTVFEQVSFQEVGNPRAVVADARFSRQLDSDEQVYQRTITVKKGWQKLDLGWIAPGGCSCLVLENKRPQWSAKPSQEEVDLAESMVVEVSFRGGIDTDSDAVLPVGETCRLRPTLRQPLYVSCPAGEARLTISAFPL